MGFEVERCGRVCGGEMGCKGGWEQHGLFKQTLYKPLFSPSNFSFFQLDENCLVLNWKKDAMKIFPRFFILLTFEGNLEINTNHLENIEEIVKQRGGSG